jgi:hypothetical protein
LMLSTVLLLVALHAATATPQPTTVAVTEPPPVDTIPWTKEEANAASYNPDVTQYCQEECPAGWSGISGLQHCYKFLSEFTSGLTQAEANMKCHEAGGALPEFNNRDEVSLMRNFFADQPDYRTQLDAHSTRKLGFFLGFARQCLEKPSGSGNWSIDDRLNGSKFSSINSPTGVMSADLWRQATVRGESANQPQDEAGSRRRNQKEEACVARKNYNNANIDGVDDYPCDAEMFVFCMKTNLATLQSRCANPDFQGTPELPGEGETFDPSVTCRA